MNRPSEPKNSVKLDDFQTLYQGKLQAVEKELRRLVRKRPSYFFSDIGLELHRFFVLSDPQFIEDRPVRHLSRLIAILYQLKKHLSAERDIFPKKRLIKFHLIPTHLDASLSKKVAVKKKVLGILVGIALKDESELCDERHIFKALLALFNPHYFVKGASYIYHNPKDPIRLVYLEIEKTDHSPFNLLEIQKIKQEFQEELFHRVQILKPEVFMTANEEESVRMMLSLSQQLRVKKDIPQVMISLSEKSFYEITFQAIVVRLKKANDVEFEKLFSIPHVGMRIKLKRKQTLGYLRKKTPKEACIVEFKLDKNPELERKDLSINFFAARQMVSHYLESKLSKFRDYNGGLIIKQKEALEAFLSHSLQEIPGMQDLKERFFYSLAPIEMQTVLLPKLLSDLFAFFYKNTSQNAQEVFTTVELDRKLAILIKSQELKLEPLFEPLIDVSAQLPWVHTFLTHHNDHYAIFLIDQPPLEHPALVDQFKQAFMACEVEA